MNKLEIERILHLQNAAYQLLLWLNERAEREPQILSDDNLAKWRYAESCETWVREIHGMIPQSLRPEPEDIPAFARLFSSFFQTSFRVVDNAPVRAYDYGGHESGFVSGSQRRLLPGAPSGKKSSKGKAKIGASARELRLIALEELALENDVLLSREALERVEDEETLRAPLAMWTWFHELRRRTQFSSQGEAVHTLWQAMDKRERERINADKIIQARDTIIANLPRP